MKIHLVWLEPDSSWINRGYAKNLHLIVNYKTKSYEYLESYGTGWADRSLVEVKRKSDIKDYVEYLKSEQFVDVTTK